MNIYSIDRMLYDVVHIRNGAPSPKVVKNLGEFEQAAAKGEGARYFPSPHVMIQNNNSDIDIVQIDRASHTMVATHINAGRDGVQRHTMVHSNSHVATFHEVLSSDFPRRDFIGISSGIGDSIDNITRYMAQSYNEVTEKSPGFERGQSLHLAHLDAFKKGERRVFTIVTSEQPPTQASAIEYEDKCKYFGIVAGPNVDMTLQVDKGMSTQMHSGRLGAVAWEDTDAHGTRQSTVLKEIDTPPCYPVSYELYSSYIPNKS